MVYALPVTDQPSPLHPTFFGQRPPIKAVSVMKLMFMLLPWVVQFSEDNECRTPTFYLWTLKLKGTNYYQLNINKSIGPDGIHPRVL